jgi:hypothetical protein
VFLKATLQPAHGVQGIIFCNPGPLFSWDTRLRMCVRVRQGYSSGGAQGSTATLQPEHGAQEAFRSKTGWLGGRMLDIHRASEAKLSGSEASRLTSIRLQERGCAPQGHSSAGTQGLGYEFVYPRATLQPGHKAQDVCSCTPGLHHRRGTRLRMRVCASRGTLQPGHGAQGTSLCTPRPLFSRDTGLRV